MNGYLYLIKNINKRYTPLLAYLVIPNIIWFELFGKFLFIFFDLLVGYLILQISDAKSENMRLAQAAVWLFNPFIFSLSTRGSSDVVISVLLFLTLYFFKREKYSFKFV